MVRESTARRLSCGSSDGPSVTAHDLKTPSISRRKSQCNRLVACFCMTDRGHSEARPRLPMLTLISSSLEQPAARSGTARITLQRYWSPISFLTCGNYGSARPLISTRVLLYPPSMGVYRTFTYRVSTVEQASLWNTSARGAAEYNLAKT
jgi:hypothetical protein